MCERSGGKPWRTMKVKAASAAEVRTRLFKLGAPSTDHDSPMKDLSLSIYVGT